ncbi:MAG: sigma 54-interacting transcriptional regulator [Calditrichia bacterium]
MAKSFQDIRSELEQQVDSSFKELTARFADLLNSAKEEQAAKSAKQIEELYSDVLSLNRNINISIKQLALSEGNDSQQLQALKAENKRLETLYASGILFSSETERSTLLQKAIEVVTRELQADAGYIVLTTEDGAFQDAFGLNMDESESEAARDMSMTVIRQSTQHSQTIHVDDTHNDISLATQNSIMHLDIQAVLCAPLLLNSKTLGAVYLDRRNKNNPFTQADQAFLLSFAQQISRGLKVSQEISALEKKLISDATLTLEQLRGQFKSEEIIGSSRVLFELLRLGSRIAPTEASLLILGESGTGKELFAQAIHQNSPRADGRFVAINCGAIPKDLLESELFGYDQGAFTGARKAKPGKIEMADGGTLFLDEIGEMDSALQTRLLRVLQQREVERLGSIKTRKIDIRILAATNKNLGALVAEGTFREDLYYRLKVIEVTLPPLRKRRDDIWELAEFFLKKHAMDSKQLSLSDAALAALETYEWPGNIRELENVMQRCVVLTAGENIAVTDLPPELLERAPLQDSFPSDGTLAEAEKAFRRNHIKRVLLQTKSRSEVARILGVNRTYLYKLLDELDLNNE